MLNAFVGSVFVGLILLGTVAICCLIMLKLLLPRTDSDYYIIIPCDKDTVGVRKQAYAFRIKHNLMGDDNHSKIVVLDNGITDAEKEALLPICKESNGIYLIGKENFKDFLDGRF